MFYRHDFSTSLRPLLATVGASLRVGATFDPGFPPPRPVWGEAQADLAAAHSWYICAFELGVIDAKRHFDNLTTGDKGQ